VRKKSIILAVLAVAVLGGLCWLVLRPREPVYQGRRLSYWLEAYDYEFKMAHFDDTARLAMAKEALRQAGTNAIPVLLQMLRAHDSALKLKLMTLARKQHIINIRFTSAETLNDEAREAFRDLGTNAWIAVPALIKIYEQNLSSRSKFQSALTLSEMGPAAVEAVPVFVHDATNRIIGDNWRGTAILSLAYMHTSPETAVPVLIKCLLEPNAYIQEAAADALAEFGENAKTAIPTLSGLARDPNLDVSAAAHRAILKIDSEAAAKLPAISVDAVK
jgi:hypothetical protein